MKIEIIKHTIKTTATPAQIWAVWQEVERWVSWDHNIELCELDGPFQSGTTGRLKMRNSPLFQIVTTSVEPYKMFIQETKLFLAKNISKHFITQLDGTTLVTFQNEMHGPLALFYTFLIGSSIRKKIPVEMEEMLKKVKI